MLVGGKLAGVGRATVVYAASVAGFIAARRWDHRCLNAGPVLQAQAAEVDPASLGYLQARLAPAVATAGWPGSWQYRFEGHGVRVMLWSQAGPVRLVGLGRQHGFPAAVRRQRAGPVRLAPGAVVQRRGRARLLRQARGLPR